VVEFFGVFFFFFQCNAIFGNIISTAVLSSGNDTYMELSDTQMAMCGSQFCSQAAAYAIVEDKTFLAPLAGELLNATMEADGEEAETGNDNFKTATWKIYIIAGIYLACSVSAAILIALFVDPLSRFGATNEKKEKPKLSGMQLLMATFKQMKRKEQLLVIPITFWSGIEQGFFGADFTAVSRGAAFDNVIKPFLFTEFCHMCLRRPHCRQGPHSLWSLRCLRLHHHRVYHQDGRPTAHSNHRHYHQLTGDRDDADLDPDGRNLVCCLHPGRPVGRSGRHLADADQRALWMSLCQ
jgi:hypothetical protein